MMTDRGTVEITEEKIVRFSDTQSYVDLSKSIADMVYEGHRNIVMDMYRVGSKIGSKHIGAIVMIHKNMKKVNGKFSLINLSDELHELLTYLHLDHIIPMERLSDSNPKK